METKIAVIGMMVKDLDCVPELNSLLSEYGNSIVGRMGIPYHEKEMNIISVVIDAKPHTIDSLKEKIEKIDGVFLV
ncbi:MAG: iron-only hydrogenase system regulator [Clostridia bacterium]|nr:iron-only hydrogenase system regulator [Clostridia bacterium]